MGLVKTGIGITKTIKNMSRVREILTVFAKHGFDEFLSHPLKIPGLDITFKRERSIKTELEKVSKRNWSRVIGHRLRLCFEELGPSFIKLGQLLGSREDIFDEGFIQEMQILRDKVKPVPFDEVEDQVVNSLEKPISEIFEELNKEAIGTASIGVVYKGKLKNGEQVVLKVKRPNVEKTIQNDFEILLFIVEQAEKVSEEIRYLGISRIVRDFSQSLQRELNFNVEALNCERLKNNLSKHDSEKLFYIPKIYKEYSDEDLLVMEFIDGIPFSSQEINNHLEDLKPKIDTSVRLFIKTFLQDGFFHADLHGGNFFLMPNGQIALIDYGLMGSLGKKGRENFMAIIYSLLTNNYENLTYEFLDVAEYSTIPDVDVLVADLRDALSPFVGLTVQQTNFSLVLKTIVNTLNKHRLYLPREWFIVFRALVTLDGVGKSLGIDIDLFTLLNEDISELIAKTFNKEELVEELIWTGRGFSDSLRILPRHMKWFIKEWSRNGYAFEIMHRGHEQYFNAITKAMLFLGYVLLASVFIVCGTLLINSDNFSHWKDISTITWIFWGMGLFSFLRASILVKGSYKLSRPEM